MALALCLTLLPTAALAAEPEGTAQTPPAVEESTDPANGEAKQENQPAAPEQEGQSVEAKQESQSAEQEEQQEDSAAKQAVAAVQAMIDALPDAKALDGMDDADAMAVYEAFQTACDAYYETLTEGQQAQLKNTEKLEALSAWFSQSAALAAGGHQHPICGASCTDDENHDNVTWTGAMGVTGLRAGGHYYLMKDVKVSETWHPEDGVVLCLNGHSITATTTSINVIEVDKGKTFTLTDCGTAGTVTHEAEKRGRGVMVFGTFNLYGGNITGNQTDGNYNDRGTFGAGVYVATYSVFNMYGGKITGNMGYSGGGGVYVAPTYADSSRAVFNMSGGEISGNSSLYGNSSGVYVNGGEFIMSGGSITGNAGYGVYLCDYKNNFGDTCPGAFTVSGKVSVTGNYKNVYNNGTLVGTLDYNVFLSTGKTITVEGTLDAASKIGISTQGEASADIATGGVGEDYDKIFSSDVKDKGYSFTKKDDGTLRFNGHDHNWQFTATTEMIKAKCTAPNCPVTASGSDEYNGGSVRLKVENTTYGDRWNNASVEASKQPAWRGPKALTIEIYYQNSVTGKDLGTTAPTLPGSYTASITVEGQTVTRGFKITKATPTIRSWQGYPYGKTFDGTQLANPASDRLTISGGTYSDIAEFNWYTATKNEGNTYIKGEKLNENPTDAGDYIIEAVFNDTDTTNAATSELGLTIQQATQYNGTVPVAVNNMHPSSVSQTFTVDLSQELTKNKVRHGDSLALAAFGITSQSDYVDLTNTALNGEILTITMKPMASNLVGMRAYVTVNVTSRNYKVIPVGITLTLQEKPTANDITVTMDDWTFGEAAKELQVNGLPTGVELTDPAVTVTYTNTKDGTTSSKRPTDAGDYTVKVQCETDTEIHTGTAEFTISPKSIEGAAVTRDQSEQVYDGGEKKPAVTSVVLDGNTLTAGTDYAVAYANNINATKLGPDSQAKIIITGTGNYTGEITVRFPINPVTLRIIGEDRMTATASYGTKVKDIPVSSTTVYYNSSKVTIVPGTWKFDGDGMDEIPEVGNTKVYRAAFTPTSGGENYRECFTYIKPSISQTAGSVTDPAAKTDLVYNGEEQALLETLPASSTGTVQYSLDGTDYTETPPMGKKAETYTVSYKVVGDKNHLNVEAQRISVKIEKLAITVTAEDKTSRVGLALAGLTYTYTPELAAGDVFTGTLETNALPDAAGSYSITQGNLALNENYTIDFHAGTYTVADKLAQSDFRFESIPSAVSKTYGDPDFSAAAVGAVEGSTVTYESSEPAVATVDGTGKVTIKGAGTAVITAKASATEEYDAAAATCTLTVEKKPIAIPTADATVFTYNGTEQTYALAEDGAYTITGNKQTNANEMGYSVTAALKDTANTQWADGTTANKTYTFVIGKAVITVKAKDQTAYVGDKAPTLGADSYTVSGLVGEEKLTTQPTVKYVGADGSEIAPDMTKTGEVKILAGGAAASDNYTIRYEDGKLTVSTRPSGGGGSSRPSTHPVQAEVSKDPDGSVSLSKANAAKGDKVTITVKPERHYEVDEVIVRDSKGKQLTVKDNGDGTFTFEMPADKVTVEPTFSWVNPFADVANSAYYVDAVEWMLKREVTQGTTETTFSPNLNCTRAQIVTFLWRAAGSPEPKGTVSFADVSAGSYYAKAVAWAIENGITGGTGDGLFSPDATCTRAQSAAFLYRAAGSPAVGGSAGFSDVAADAYYAQAVAWTKEHGITDGIGGGLFGSANGCTRAQIAAFLWRLYAEK